MTDDSDGFPDLPEVPPTQQMQDLMSAYRDQTHRSNAQIEAALQSITAQVGTAGATATAAGLSTTAKVGLTAALLGVVGVVGLALGRPDPQPEPHAAQVEQAGPVAMNAPTAGPVVEAEPEFVEPETSPAPEPPPKDDIAGVDAPRPRARTKPKAKPRAKPEVMPANPAPVDTLADELRRLQQVRAALRGGTPARARSLIESHRRDYPHSTLARERDATEIAALCSESRDADAKRKAAAFAKAYPGSSQDLLADCDG